MEPNIRPVSEAKNLSHLSWNIRGTFLQFLIHRLLFFDRRLSFFSDFKLEFPENMNEGFFFIEVIFDDLYDLLYIRVWIVEILVKVCIDELFDHSLCFHKMDLWFPVFGNQQSFSFLIQLLYFLDVSLYIKWVILSAFEPIFVIDFIVQILP